MHHHPFNRDYVRGGGDEGALAQAPRNLGVQKREQKETQTLAPKESKS